MTTATAPAFCAAKDQLFAFKSREVLDYALAFVRAGVMAARSSRAYFSSEDVPESCQPASPQVSGAATSMLLNAHIIGSYFGHNPEAGIFYGRKRSSREKRNGAKINLYQIESISRAETFLARHGRGISEFLPGLEAFCESTF